MIDLRFSVVGAQAEKYAAVPTISLRVRIEDAGGEPIHSIALRSQIQIEPRRRLYAEGEEESLLELFGERRRWGDTMKTLAWTIVSTMVPSFTGSVEVDVPLICTYDFEVAASKYLNALEAGEVSLLLLFSGTIFVKTESSFSVEQVPWEKEAPFRLPVRVWREAMDHFFPGSAWIRIRKDTFDTLYRFKAARSLTSWEEAIELLLEEAREKVPS